MYIALQNIFKEEKKNRMINYVTLCDVFANNIADSNIHIPNYTYCSVLEFIREKTRKTPFKYRIICMVQLLWIPRLGYVQKAFNCYYDSHFGKKKHWAGLMLNVLYSVVKLAF